MWTILHSMKNEVARRLQPLKLLHTVVWAVFAGCVLALPWLTGQRRFGAAAVLATIVGRTSTSTCPNGWPDTTSGSSGRCTRSGSHTSWRRTWVPERFEALSRRFSLWRHIVVGNIDLSDSQGKACEYRFQAAEDGALLVATYLQYLFVARSRQRTGLARRLWLRRVWPVREANGVRFQPMELAGA